ncbi:MAG: carboxypeptidase regulatory-like domain-containing protein [Proteobacteria bacterium]|nr:carboxypeptidase regulatory-like domain-containing protein [Pseudomonadota bacterium]
MSGVSRCIGALAGALCIFAGCGSALAQGAQLGGRVSSAEEGVMEGVLVSARAEGSTVSLTVVSDKEGLFRFPAGKLRPGKHSLAIRAVGYELDGSAQVEIAAADPAPLDLRLRKTRDLAAQLTNTEWFISTPGTAEQKRPLIECLSCHTFERIARSTQNAEEMLPVLKRMVKYANNSTMARVQTRIVERGYDENGLRKLAEYLATINLSKGPQWSYPLKTLPRPAGRATRVLITEYDLPRKTIAPHDVILGRDGALWYSNFTENFLGRLDPRSGEHSEFAYPEVKPGWPQGALSVEADRKGDLWLSTMFQTGLIKFDMKTRVFRHFPLPPELNGDATGQAMVMPAQSHVDVSVWTTDVDKLTILRLDLKSGKYQSIAPFQAPPRHHFPSGLAADKANNLYFMDFGGEALGRVDAKTTKVTIYPTPTPRSRPRRTMIDGQGRVWFAEYGANRVAMFDTKREEIREWEAPTPHTYPYDVHMDKYGTLWSGSMTSDRILRLDPQTNQSIEYLLPRQTNVRRVFVDDRTKPVTFWVGSNHGASIVGLTPID